MTAMRSPPPPSRPARGGGPVGGAQPSPAPPLVRHDLVTSTWTARGRRRPEPRLARGWQRVSTPVRAPPAGRHRQDPLGVLNAGEAPFWGAPRAVPGFA